MNTSASEMSAHWRSQEMLLLQQVMSLAERHLSGEQVFREMLHLASELVGLNRGRIVLLDEDGREGCIRYYYGLTAEEAERGRYRPGEGITGTVLATGQLAVVQDIDEEAVFLNRAVARSHLPAGQVAFIAVPITVDGRVAGTLACHRLRQRSRSLSDDVVLLRILATLAGQILHVQSYLQERTRDLEQQNSMLTQAINTRAARYGIVGSSPALLRAIGELERVSEANASVLLLGESGTGKELFARALHLASPRHDKPFIKVNCAAIPESLFESELFGHEKGAFTGASAARAGWFEQAHTGSIFLDEIGELPLAMQAKLLRTLQEGTITRLGSMRERSIDVRLVAATHRNLEQLVAEGLFREDLFYRLNVIPIRLPSLAERSEDIPAIALHLLNHANQAHQRNVNLSADAIAALHRQPWPGNVRELGNVIERLVLLSERTLVQARDVAAFLPAGGASAVGEPVARTNAVAAAGASGASTVLPGELAGNTASATTWRPYAPSTSHSAEDLLEALRASGGNKSRAAQQLGLTARQFQYRWQKHGL